MRRFEMYNLPKDVYEKLYIIRFYYEDCELKGLAYLKVEYATKDTNSRGFSFKSRNDLIDIVRNNTYYTLKNTEE